MKNEEQYVENVLNTTNSKLTSAEAKLLLSLAKDIPRKGVIVEIGSYTGGSTILLAKGSRMTKGKKVYAIDAHTHVRHREDGVEIFSTIPAFRENLKNANVHDWVIPVVKMSARAVSGWKNPVGLLWIDGSHDYRYVKMDFLLWEKYLVEEGIIAFHDTNWPGPNRVIKEYIQNSERFNIIKKVDTITVVKKVKNANTPESLKISLRLFPTRIITSIDETLGEFGIFLSKNFPRFYCFLNKKTRSVSNDK